MHNVEFEKVEVGKGEPIEAGDYTVKTETTYDLIMRESEADLYIKTEKRTDKMFEATCVYKYVFKQGTYGVIEVSENAIKIELPVFEDISDLTDDEHLVLKALSKTVLKSISEIVPSTPFGKSKVSSLLKIFCFI